MTSDVTNSIALANTSLINRTRGSLEKDFERAFDVEVIVQTLFVKQYGSFSFVAAMSSNELTHTAYMPPC